MATDSRLLIKAAMTGAEVGHLADAIARLERAGVDALHFDVRDGRFGPEISMGVIFVRGLRKYTRLPFEVHLWIAGPEPDIDSYIDAGADYVIVHLEACRDPAAALVQIRDRGRKTGLAINPGTPVDGLIRFLDLCDEINVMTVRPGRPGELDEQGVENLRQVVRLVTARSVAPLVQVDGAVSMKTRALFLGAGARSMVVGYPIFSRSDFGAAVAEMRYGTQSLTSV